MNVPKKLMQNLPKDKGGRSTRLKALKRYYDNPNKCLYCHKTIHVPMNKMPYYAKLQKFCNHSCSASYNNKGLRRHGKGPGKCANCNKKLITSQRKYCSRMCQHKYIYNQYIKGWLDGNENGMSGQDGVSVHIRKYLFDKYNNKCRKCGWSKINKYTQTIPLTIHHKNGNWKDNRRRNLELLCYNCHSLTPNFGNRNKGKGRRTNTGI